MIIAAAGNDCLLGDEGNDVLSDGNGQDKVHGGAGDDRVVAAADAADDTYDGGAGHDTLDYSTDAGGVTADLQDGTVDGCETGHDAVANFEEVVGGSGDDHIIAASTAISMTGGAGNDQLEGGAGNDTISDGAGCDTVSGGGGDDHVVAAADAANDCYDGGAGQDSLDYSTATFSITVDVGRGTADGLDIGHDLIASFEEVIGGSGDDHIVAGSASVSMTGGDGDDTFEFQRAEDDRADDDGPQDHRTSRLAIASWLRPIEISYLQEQGAAADQFSDMFSDIYLTADEDHHRPVRFRFEQIDSNECNLRRCARPARHR